MSSFVGHTLVALTLYLAPHPTPPLPRWWAGALVVFALAPDVDYVVPALRPFAADQVVRLTHSIAGSVLLPTLTLLVLKLLRYQLPHWRLLCLQAYGAGLSHIVLDLLVGVTPLPLAWPLSWATFVLPFGLLPSAGHIALTNFYFYRNLVIEIGVLLPLAIGTILWPQPNPTWRRILGLSVLGLIAAVFCTWAFSLPR